MLFFSRRCRLGMTFKWYLACSAGVLLGRVSVTTLRPPSVRRWVMGEGKSEIFFAPPPPLSFLLSIVHPLGRSFFLPPVFHCLKNSRCRETLLRCKCSPEQISPALQAKWYRVFGAAENLFGDLKPHQESFLL